MTNGAQVPEGQERRCDSGIQGPRTSKLARGSCCGVAARVNQCDHQSRYGTRFTEPY